ncbi:MAG TPA: lysophospholipid acyltransferase family protein [Cellulomonas sp.]
MFYWLMKRVLVGPLLHLLFRPWVRGIENVPTTGGAILASNHLAVIDSFVLPLVLDREIVFIGKSEYFTGTGIKGRLKAGFFRGVGTIPVDRSGGKASEAALHTGLLRLEAGGLFGIYPEGTRSPDGRLYRGKTGVARLALESGVPVIPIAMIGTDVAQPIGRTIPRPVRIGVVVGEPLDFSRYKGMENDRFILRSVTDEIMYSLMSLSGQEYVDVYAATQKARIATGHPAAKLPAQDAAATAPGGRPVPDVHVPVPPEDDAAPSVG